MIYYYYSSSNFSVASVDILVLPGFLPPFVLIGAAFVKGRIISDDKGQQKIAGSLRSTCTIVFRMVVIKSSSTRGAMTLAGRQVVLFILFFLANPIVS